MKALAQRKTRLIVETSNAVFERGQLRAVVVELKAGFATLHLKGCQRTWDLSYSSMLRFAVEMGKANKRAQSRQAPAARSSNKRR